MQVILSDVISVQLHDSNSVCQGGILSPVLPDVNMDDMGCVVGNCNQSSSVC